jgi:hypothetical protein
VTAPPPIEFLPPGPDLLTLEGRLRWSSNATFLVGWDAAGERQLAIYKPAAGERPLWDFPPGTLHLRELAAYLASEALRWHQIPDSVVADGPLGPGLLQRFVAHDPDRHLLAIEDPDPLWVHRIAAFDAIINNADRKSGHVLEDSTGRLWAIDHGLTFHNEPKLRTVIWQYAGLPVPGDILADIDELALRVEAGDLAATFSSLLSPLEVAAFVDRMRHLVLSGTYPPIPDDRPEIPWPPV